MSDPDRRILLIHQLEQFSGVLRQIAPTLAAFHSALVEQGFTRDEALVLVSDLMKELYKSAREGPPE